MTKSSRLSLIRSRYLALFGAAISGLLPVTATEVATEARAIAKHRVSDTALDESEMEVPSQLTFDRENAPDKDSEILLSAKEKRQLVRDMDKRNRDVDGLHWNRGKAKGMWLVVVQS